MAIDLQEALLDCPEESADPDVAGGSNNQTSHGWLTASLLLVIRKLSLKLL